MVRLRVVHGEDLEAPSTRYPNGQLLLDPDALAWAVLDRGSALLDVRARNAYRAAHLPTAVHLGLDLDPDRPLPSRTVLDRALARAGLTPDRPVVVYDERSTEGSAAHALLVLEHLGFRDVRVLDGGIDAWRQAGRTLEIALRIRLGGAGIQENELVTRSSRLAKRPPHLERARRGERAIPAEPERVRMIAAEDLAALVRAGAVVVIDGRTQDHFDGSRLAGEQRGGHVPGALSLPTQLLFDDDGGWRDGEGLGQALVRAGVPGDAEVVTAGGREGALLYLALRLLDHPSVRALEGGMKTWLDATALPAETRSE